MNAPTFLPQTQRLQRAAGDPNWMQRSMITRMMRPVVVEDVVTVAPRLRRITLSGEVLAAAAFAPGLRVGLVLDDSLVGRVYTPLTWDRSAGTLTLLLYLNGLGPGSHWAQALQPRQTCGFMGPNTSVALPPPDVRGWMFGDETSLATAGALAAHGGLADRRIVLVLPEGHERVLADLGLADITWIRRGPEDKHLPELLSVMGQARLDAGPIVLTGEAAMITAVRRHLRDADVAASRIKTRAYWAKGKAALS